MTATVWTGHLSFGLISLPVRLYSGARSARVSFHMLHRDDLTRVRTQLFCPNDGRVVERSEIVKGYEYRKGEYVVVEPQEIKKVEPETSKAMELMEFVKAEEVDPIYFETSYYLMPEEAGRRPYALLVRALEKSDYVGIAKLTMHNREYTCIVRPSEGWLMLHTMYYQAEIRHVGGFGETSKIDVKEGEIKVAQQLIEALATDFEPEKYRDTFKENLRKLIQARLEGKDVTPVENPRKPAPVVDLLSALKQSLSQMEGKKKPAARAESAQPTRKSKPRSGSRKKRAA